MAPKKPTLTIVQPNGTGFQPPRPLGEHGLKLWQAVQAQYRVQDIGGVELLVQACAGVDRLEALAARIAQDGEVIRGATGLRAHPLLREETALRGFVCKTLQKLGIVIPEQQKAGWAG
jgi:hypothetical protein